LPVRRKSHPLSLHWQLATRNWQLLKQKNLSRLRRGFGGNFALASSYLPRFSARISIEGHGQELAPDETPADAAITGCCGVTGPNPQPLWIRNVFSCPTNLTSHRKAVNPLFVDVMCIRGEQIVENCEKLGILQL
jgi:hypothetical protein